MDNYFEQGPIRPPSEAHSLLIRVTRNCPWNKCAFCRTYKREKFAFRSLAEINADLHTASAAAIKIKELSEKEGESGIVTEKILRNVFNTYPMSNVMHMIALWLYYGGDSVFIQDADSLVMKTEDVITILQNIKKFFPLVERITTYCRSKTAARKSTKELKMLSDAGLSRIHIGMESGYDPLLKFIRKGVTAAEHIDGGLKVREAGISLSEYIIPGLGGKLWTDEHAIETARVINAINPDFVRLRSLHISKDTYLMELVRNGTFEPLDDDEIVNEIRKFISGLSDIGSMIVSDHVLNLLEELEGRFPDDKTKLLVVLDRYLSLSEKDKLIFRLGKRKGIVRRIDDLQDPESYQGLQNTVDQFEKTGKGMIEKHLSMIMDNYV